MKCRRRSSERSGNSKAYAASAALADDTFADQLDACSVQGANQFHERIDIASDHAVARFHALDRWNGKARDFRQLALVDSEQRPRGPKLA